MIILDIDMKKPKTCWGCKFNGAHTDDRCFFLQEYTDDPYYSKHIREGCPIRDFDEVKK